MKQSVLFLRKEWVSYISILIFSLNLALLSLMQLYFHEIYKYSVLQSSMLLSLATIGQFVGSLLSRYYLRIITYGLCKINLETVCPLRFAICLLAFLVGLIFIFLGYSQNYSSLLVLSFLLGICLALFLPLNMALLTNNCTVEETVVVNFLRRCFINIGASFGFVIIGFLIKNFKVIFIGMSFMCWMLFLLEAISLFKARNNHSRVVLDNKKIQISFISKSFLIWVGGVFLGYCVFFQTLSVYPIFLHDYANVSIDYYSRLMIINVAIVILFQFVAPMAEKYMSISLVSALGAFLVGMGIFIVTFKSSEYIILSIIIWSIGEIFFLGITPVYAKIFAGDYQEKNLQYSSIYYTVYYAAKMITPFFGSYFYSVFNFHEVLLAILFIIALISCCCFLWLGAMLKNQKRRIFYESQT